MKKLLSIILAVAVILSVTLIPTTAITLPSDYSFGYEEDVSLYCGTAERSTERAHSGSYSMKINTSITWKIPHAPLAQSLSNSVCGSYHTVAIDFWMYVDSSVVLSRIGSGAGDGVICVYTNGGADGSGSGVSGHALGPTTGYVSKCPINNGYKGAEVTLDSSCLGNWTHISVTFANSGKDMYPCIWFPNTRSGYGGNIYIDDVQVNGMAYGTYAGGTARTLKDLYEDAANRDLLVPGVNGAAIPEPEARTGYVFEGYYSENTYVNKYTNYANGVNTYYAHWLPIEDFEGSPYVIEYGGDPPTLLSDEDAYSGTYSLKLDCTKANWGNMGGALNIKTGLSANTTYKITFKYNVPTSCNKPITVHAMLTANGDRNHSVNPAVSFQIQIPANTTTAGWVDGVIAVTTPASFSSSGYNRNCLAFIVKNSAGGAGSATSGVMYFDDILATELVGESAVAYNANGGTSLNRTWEFVTNGSAVPYTPTSFLKFNGWYSDAACTSPVTTVTTSGTLYAGWEKLSNSFEDGYTSDQAAQKYTINTNPAYVHSGSQSIHMSGDVSWTTHCASVGKITPGSTYLVDFWYYLPTLPTVPIVFTGITYANDYAWPMGSNVIQVSGTDNISVAGNTQGTTYPIRDWYTSNAGSWQHAYFVMQTDSTSSYTTFGLNFIAIASGTADVYIDDITLTEVEDDEQILLMCSTYVDGANHIVPVIVSEGDEITASLVENFGAYAPSNKYLDHFVAGENAVVTTVAADTTAVWGVWETAAASYGGVGYETLGEALTSSSGAVVLTKDITGESSITVNSGTVLNLAGKSITGATGIVANGVIKDESAPENKAVVSATNITFGACADYFPIYNNNTTGKGNGYSFYKAGMNSTVSDSGFTEAGSGRIVFALKKGTKWDTERYGAFDLLVSGNSSSKVKAVVEVNYTSGGTPQTATYTYSDGKMAQYCNKSQNKAFSLTFKGVDQMEGRVTATTKFVIYDGNGYVIGTFGATEQVLKAS